MGHVEAPVVEQMHPLHFTRVNPFSYLVSHNNFLGDEVLELSPPKIRTRLMLTNSEWCCLGTAFVPPGESLSFAEIEEIHRRINQTNRITGRPYDPEIIIRTAGIDMFTRWQSRSYIVKPKGNNEVMAKDLSRSTILPFDSAMKLIRGNWKIIHGENKEEQEKAVHGKLHVSSDDLSLELATDVIHARSLDKCLMTTFHLDILNGIGFTPTSLRIMGQLTEQDAAGFIRDCYPLGKQLGEFVDWISTNLRLSDYVIDFRYYMQGCKPTYSFNVLDLDSYLY